MSNTRVLIIGPGPAGSLAAFSPGETKPVAAEVRALPHPRYPGACERDTGRCGEPDTTHSLLAFRAK